MSKTSHFIDDHGHLNEYVLDTLGFSASHTSENLHLYLNARAHKWNVQKKIEVVITDNATTITNAVVMRDFKSLRCIAHTLNLAVKDISEKEEKIIDL
jgi:zinc finger BED domain-containing protein 1 (E3 SUMO-protein ligase ZBED1)